MAMIRLVFGDLPKMHSWAARDLSRRVDELNECRALAANKTTVRAMAAFAY
jgi:hypothetical protein